MQGRKEWLCGKPASSWDFWRRRGHPWLCDITLAEAPSGHVCGHNLDHVWDPAKSVICSTQLPPRGRGWGMLKVWGAVETATSPRDSGPEVPGARGLQAGFLRSLVRAGGTAQFLRDRHLLRLTRQPHVCHTFLRNLLVTNGGTPTQTSFRTKGHFSGSYIQSQLFQTQLDPRAVRISLCPLVLPPLPQPLPSVGPWDGRGLWQPLARGCSPACVCRGFPHSSCRSQASF